jgi:AraC-like DNA-binding protein
MNPQLIKVIPNPNHSFSVRRDVVPYFYNRWHFHPEIELVHIEEGYGIQFMGDSISRFGKGDVLLIGSGLPHYWRCDDVFFESKPNPQAIANVAHFKHSFWGAEFLDLPENKKIKDLLLRAKRGILVPEKVRQDIIDILKSMLPAEGAERLYLLLKALHLLAEQKELHYFSSAGYSLQVSAGETERINEIYKYSLTHFREKITLAQVASLANMSPTAFCRFFKGHTKKNFNSFLHELRIGHASKLLIENKRTITQVCHDSGFNNVTNFYKTFKKVTGKTPQEYQKSYLG